MDDHNRVAEVVRHTRLFQDFAGAFYNATGVRLVLEPEINSKIVSALNNRSPSKSKVAQLEILGFGMYKIVVPLKHGLLVFGIIRTGLILESPMTVGGDASEMPVIPKVRGEALLTLIKLFAEYLGSVCNQLTLRQVSCEPGFITKAKAYIESHLGDKLSLFEVAQNVNVNSYHLCKMFKKITGLNFSTYIARLRIEVAKELLAKGPLRINEIAMEAGFQSLAQFNKTFKNLVGESPRCYRERLTYLEIQRSSSNRRRFLKLDTFAPIREKTA